MGCSQSTKSAGDPVSVSEAQAHFDDNKELKSLEKFVDDIIARAEPWTDPDFKPESCSLNDEHDQDQQGRFDTFSWIRCSELYKPDQMDIFVDKIEVSDVDQGELGDCYFLAVLSAMAEKDGNI